MPESATASSSASVHDIRTGKTFEPPPAEPKKLTQQERSNMAFRYYDWLLLTKKIPSGGFRLLYAISQCLNEENPFHCFPSIEHLATHSGRRESSVWAMLPKIEKAGSIEIEWGSRGSRHPNTYRLPAKFLEFYFGPEKGRLSVPKKPRQTGVSKPRQTGVSDALKTPVCGLENPDPSPIKPRRVGVNYLLATYGATKNSAPPGARAAVVESQSNVTEETKSSAPDGAGSSPEENTPMTDLAELERLAQEFANTPGIQMQQIRPRTEHLSNDQRYAVILRWTEIIQERKQGAAA